MGQGDASWFGSALGGLGSLVGDVGGVLDAGARIMDKTLGAAPSLAGEGDNFFGGMGGVGDLMSGAGKLLNFDEAGNWDPNAGGVGDLVSGGVGMLDSLGVTNMGPWGAAIGGTAQFAANLAEMSQHSEERTGDYFGNNYWASAGDATLGALHAGLGSWCPVAELYISGFELAGDAVGGASGLIGEGVEFVDGLFGDDEVEDRQWSFGAGDVLGWGLHGLHDLADAVIPGEDSMAGVASVVDTVGGGIHDAGSAVVSFIGSLF